MLRNVREAHQQSLARIMRNRLARKRVRHQAVCARAASELDIGPVLWKAGEQMQAAGFERYFDMGAEFTPQRCGECVAPCAISCPHPLKVSREMAFGHEGCDDRLLEDTCASV